MIKRLQEREIEPYYVICPAWRLEEYQDRTGRRNPDCVVFGAEKEDGTPQGLLLLQRTGEREYEIGILCCNILTQSRAASELLQMAEGYVAAGGGGTLRYGYVMPQPEPMDHLLQMRYWEAPKEQAVVYQIRGGMYPIRMKEDYVLKGEIGLFAEIPVRERIRFAERFGQDIEAYLDYRLCEDMDPDMSLAYMVDGKLAGYLLIRTWGAAMEVNRFYVEPEHRGCFGAMVQQLYKRYGERQPAVQTVYICTVNDVSEKLVQHMFGTQIVGRQYVKQATLSIKE